MRREGTVHEIFFLFFIVVCGNLKLQLVTERHSGRHPDLAQFVVTVPLEAIVKLLAVFLEVIREAKPLDGQQKHPIDRLLECFMSAWRLIELAHALFAVAQVKCFFLVDFHQGTLPGTERGALMDITKESIARTIIECIGNDQFWPTV